MEKYQCPSGQQAEKRSENDSFSHRTQGQASGDDFPHNNRRAIFSNLCNQESNPFSLLE